METHTVIDEQEPRRLVRGLARPGVFAGAQQGIGSSGGTGFGNHDAPSASSASTSRIAEDQRRPGTASGPVRSIRGDGRRTRATLARFPPEDALLSLRGDALPCSAGRRMSPAKARKVLLHSAPQTDSERSRPQGDCHEARRGMDRWQGSARLRSRRASDQASIVNAPRSPPRRKAKHQEVRVRNRPDDEHQFFHEVARALEGEQVLLVGPSKAKLHFVRYLQRHEPALRGWASRPWTTPPTRNCLPISATTSTSRLPGGASQPD